MKLISSKLLRTEIKFSKIIFDHWLHAITKISILSLSMDFLEKYDSCFGISGLSNTLTSNSSGFSICHDSICFFQSIRSFGKV
ncbi:MAG: hypothetical protein U9Q66_00790 [Patescibacteria group bacterium]|nr:hypothetical protein [Patescibacteria group bacterium]